MAKRITKRKRNKQIASSRISLVGRFFRRNFPFILIGAGLGLVVLSVAHFFFSAQALRLSRAQAELLLQTKKQSPILPTHIFIPWNTDADIESLPYQNGNWGISDTKVTYLLGSALPGNNGNMILYGHNKREILGNIRALKGGEPITITMADGKVFSYTVSSVIEVNPASTALLAQTDKEVLTLYTCSGFLDSQRFIVRAIRKLT